MIIKFDSNLLTGIESIDTQHKELCRRINTLYEACMQGRSRDEIEKLMGFLNKYVETHFQDEENYMQKYVYREFNRHRAAHNTFRQTYNDLVKYFETNGTTSLFIIKVNKTLVDWFISHIGEEDKALCEFLKTKGLDKATL